MKKIRYSKKLIISLTIISVLVFGFYAFADEALKDIQIQYFNISPTTPPSGGSAPTYSSKWITAWVDHNNNIYHFGEKIKLFIKSTKDCYIYIIDIGTSGCVTLIYPNEYDKNNFLKANTVKTIPPVNANYSFIASGPQGRELIKIIATSRPVSMDELSNISKRKIGPYTQITGDPKKYAKDIQVQLNEMPNLEWDTYNKVITLVP